MDKEPITEFISRINNIDTNMQKMLTNGGCYGFAKYLQYYYPDGKLYKTKQGSHVVLMLGNNLYDIRGLLSDDMRNYSPVDEADEEHMKAWSSDKQLEFIKKKEFTINDKIDNEIDSPDFIMIGIKLLAYIMSWYFLIVIGSLYPFYKSMLNDLSSFILTVIYGGAILTLARRTISFLGRELEKNLTVLINAIDNKKSDKKLK